MLSRTEQDELDRLEKRFQKTRRGLSKAEQAELDRLEARYAKTRAAKPPEPEKPEAKPEIHVHVDLPEITTTQPARAPEPCAIVPRKWIFEHKYDEYGKLVKTTATAQ